MNPRVEKLNLVAAALMTAVGAHALLCFASLSAVFKRSQDGTGAMMKAVLVLWAVSGITAGLVVIFQALGFLNASSYRHARTAAIGAILLPFFGAPGMATAFALVPLGAFTLWLLGKPDWKSPFEENVITSKIQVPTEPPIEAVGTSE